MAAGHVGVGGRAPVVLQVQQQGCPPVHHAVRSTALHCRALDRLSHWAALPYTVQVTSAYRLLDGFRHSGVEGQPSITALMQEADELRKQQDLFELYVSDYIFLLRCMVGAGEPRTAAGLPRTWASCLGQVTGQALWVKQAATSCGPCACASASRTPTSALPSPLRRRSLAT